MKLIEQQQALLATLFDWPADDAIDLIASYQANTWARGLKVYQSNAHALAQRALLAAYPVLAQLIGQESFQALARCFWHSDPPQRGDIGQWGAQLPEFVRVSSQLEQEPYLADVAALEWQLHACATLADQAMDAPSFALLSTQEPTNLQLCLAPGCVTLASLWPVVSIVGAHVEQHPSFAEVGELIQAQVAQSAIVWRQGVQPRFRLAVDGESALIEALAGGASLAQAVREASSLSMDTWLPMAVQSGLVLGVRLHP